MEKANEACVAVRGAQLGKMSVVQLSESCPRARQARSLERKLSWRTSLHSVTTTFLSSSRFHILLERESMRQAAEPLG